MKNQKITEIEQHMLPYLDNSQMEHLHEILQFYLQENPMDAEQEKPVDLVETFLAAKRVEGCSAKTVRYYDSTIRNVISAVGKDVKQISTDDIRMYLDKYQTESSVSKVTIDNIRRILSSFFAWL